MQLNNIWATATAVALAVSLATSAQAATLDGQGASLPELAYTGVLNSTYPAATAPVAASLFGYLPAGTVSYAGTGSGAGKNAIINNTSPFAGSDSPLTQTNYSAVIAGAGGIAHTAPLQVPAIVGSVAVVYKLAGAPALNLTSVTVAKIFAGEITNWNQVSGSGVVAPASLPIQLVARGSGSGTTFSFINHLNAVGGLAAGKFFKVDELYSNAVTTVTGAPTFISASNNADLITKVNAANGRIGYAEAGNAYVASPSVGIAKIAGKSPDQIDTAFLGTTGAIVAGQAITGTNAAGAATIGALTGAPVGKAGYVQLVKPASYANPATGYPIVAVSYLLGYTNSNANLATAKTVLKTPYDANAQAALGATGSKGFGFVPAAQATNLIALINSIL